MNRGVSAGAGGTGVVARVDVASRLSSPVQPLDFGGHTMSSGDGVDLARGVADAGCTENRWSARSRTCWWHGDVGGRERSGM
jgi:hypothetical protein